MNFLRKNAVSATREDSDGGPAFTGPSLNQDGVTIGGPDSA